MAIIYQIISLVDVICKFREQSFDITKEVSALSKNILAVKYQSVFQPIDTVRYKRGGLRSKKPPFEYRILDVTSAKRFYIHKKLGLGLIRAKIDTTFREDKQKQTNPFLNRWTPNLGVSSNQQKRKANKILKIYKRREKWITLLVQKGFIKKVTAKVAVILTSYNRPNLVQKAIRSVFAQTFCDWHLYIIDNNSNANTKNILRRYKIKYPTKITLKFYNTLDAHRLIKCWLSVMINWGIREGKERYITLLTDDCWLAPCKLAVMTEFLDKHPHIQLCYGTQVIVNKAGRHLRQRFARRVIGPKRGGGILDHNQVMFRRTLIKKVGYWNESKHVMGAPDADFWKRTPAKYPIETVTDFYLEHKNRFQYFYFNRGKKRSDLKKSMVME